MGAQPVRQGAGLPVGEQVHRPPGLDVDEDRTVDAAAAEREVIDLSGVRTNFCHVFAGSDVHDGVRSVVRRC
jgi:hypothetical protein